jgi:mono/diheme cytochrome c family protein
MPHVNRSIFQLLASGAGFAALAAAAAFDLSRPSPAQAAEDGAALYSSYCASCHGAAGRGDGAAAVALDPKPANFSDPKFWETRNEADVKKVIKEGGASVGKSPLMIAWGSALDDAKIDAVVAQLKTFKAK